VARRADGSYRVVASRHLDHLKGPFRFRGTRAADKNDVVPHEHRRDIRGLRIICAWINHEDIKSDNTVTQYVSENGRRFLKHYLWDFGSTLGSDGVAPNYIRSGHANALDIRLTGERLVTLGLWKPRWKRHPLPVLFPSVGRFGSQYFEPDKWKSTMPNRAFDNLTKADAFWAAKIAGSFTDDHIRAAVRAGRLSSRAAEDYLVKTLAERRNIILKHYFGRVSPVQNFTTGPVNNRTQRIYFTDLGVRHGIGPNPPVYTYRFFLTNAAGGAKPLTPVLRVTGTQSLLVTPEVFNRLDQEWARAEGEAGRRVIHLELRAGSADPVRAYFVYEGADKGLRCVGIEHEA